MEIQNAPLITTFLSALALSTTSFGGSLDLGADFQAGQVASAAEVNAKFQAIEDAINTIQDQLDGTHCSNGDVVGDYKLIELSVGRGGGDNFLHSEHEHLKADFCFQANGSVRTFNAEDTFMKFVEASGPQSAADPKNPVEVVRIESSNNDPNLLESFSGTYALSGGCRLDITVNNETFKIHMNSALTMGVGVGGGKNELCENYDTLGECDSNSSRDVGDSHHAELFVLVKKGPGATYCSSLQ